MQNVDKGRTGIKFVMAVLPKIPRILHNLFGRSAQICPNIWDIIEKSPCWVPQSVIWEEADRKMPIHFLPYIHAYLCVVLQQTYMPYNYKVYTFTSKKWPPFFGGLLYNVERNLPLAHTLHVNEKKTCLVPYTPVWIGTLVNINNLFHSI